MKPILYFVLFVILPIAATSFADDYPISSSERRRSSFGSIIDRNKEGRVTILGKSMDSFGKKTELSHNPRTQKDDSPKSGLSHDKVNQKINLWRAALEHLQDKPVLVSDFAGGIIATDWFSPETSPNVRYRINILVQTKNTLDRSLRVNILAEKYKDSRWTRKDNAVKVTVEMQDKLKKEIIAKYKSIKNSNE